MDNKYIAVVYDDEMSDILKKADILGTYQGMKANSEGRYVEMDYYQVGFDYATWKQLRDAKVSMHYIDREGNAFEFVQGRCNNLNTKVKITDIVAKAEARANLFREQLALKDKYATDTKGIVEFKEKKTNAVNNKKAKSLVAYDTNSDLVMPFREIVNGVGDLPIFIYLHDKKSRSADNTTVLLKECKSLLQALKASGEGYILVVPNVVTSYGMMTREEGRKVQKASCLDNLLRDIIDHEIADNGGDKNRVYIMGMGTGVADALCELNVNNERYAGAMLAFGEGWYPRNIDILKDVQFEIVSASDDYDVDEELVAAMAGDIESIGASVHYNAMEGTRPDALKALYKDKSWLSNIFEASRRVTGVAAPQRIEQVVEPPADETVATDEDTE